MLIDDEPDYLFVTEDGTFRSRTRYQDDDGEWVSETEEIENGAELVEIFNPADLYASFVDAAEAEAEAPAGRGRGSRTGSRRRQTARRTWPRQMRAEGVGGLRVARADAARADGPAGRRAPTCTTWR